MELRTRSEHLSTAGCQWLRAHQVTHICLSEDKFGIPGKWASQGGGEDRNEPQSSSTQAAVSAHTLRTKDLTKYVDMINW